MNSHLRKPIELKKVIETLTLYCLGNKSAP